MVRLFFLLAMGTGQMVAAELPDTFTCSGASPDWTIDFAQDAAVFRFGPLRTEMDLMLDTPAESSPWPRALTFVGDRDTGILIMIPRACGAKDYEALMLTQRGQTPLLLTGCCGTTP